MTPVPAKDRSLTARLREATAEQHRELENWVDPARRFALPARYAAYLQEIHPLFAGFEAALALLPWGKLDFDLEPRRKAPLIERDLRFLGRDPFPARETPPRFESLAAGLGCLYVLEGSTLGGQYILRELEKRDITPEKGAAFFACYGARTQEMWRSFKEMANAFCVEEPRAAEAEDAARETFARYRRGVSPLE